ncbi:PTS fructose transporter subunit IIB [Anaerotalea alkaliphila]|uniref:PTS fructose transporter subunit IIB n=1 Tax=Anaerotalea alkaliphila TaxID=2662126 RepID=A0A7X5HWB8_9FIRM|nr:PTS fructose transporter subunit IIB [Anaerotalea alkaliphila]NDL67850.1 PTS fructose transporter subunit IIB [Anaerotalea alkaliphila]
MKIVGITACTAGIAHTYIAKEKLESAARSLGHEVKIETQGSIGVENELTLSEIKDADVVIIAADITVSKERFAGKPVVDVPISLIMKSPKSVVSSVASKLKKD